MSNALLKLAEQALLFVAKHLPESVRPFVDWVARLLGSLDLPDGDPRLDKAARLVSQLLVDLEELERMEDGTARDKARLILENRFGRAWIEAGLSGGGI